MYIAVRIDPLSGKEHILLAENLPVLLLASQETAGYHRDAGGSKYYRKVRSLIVGMQWLVWHNTGIAILCCSEVLVKTLQCVQQSSQSSSSCTM